MTAVDTGADPVAGTVAKRAEVELVVEVVQRRDAADGVVVLELAAPDGAALPVWEPGAHVDLQVGDGTWRQYSLCGDPADPRRWRIAVLLERDGRGGSRWVHGSVRAGDSVRVRGPRNHFRFEPSDRHLFIAGGIGITPILPMIAAAEAAGSDWRLVYGGRARTSMAFVDDLRARGDRVEICPEAETGLLDLGRLLASPTSGTLVYCCGPEPLLDAVEQRCRHWPDEALRVERFTPATTTEELGSGTAFEVELARSGGVYTVPADRAVLSVLEEAGVDVPSSCSEGTCGTCETAVLAGDPDHRDSVLGPHERIAGDRMMVCVSRSLGPRLVLDL